MENVEGKIIRRQEF